MSNRARRAFVPLLALAFLIASAISDPGASRSYSMVGTVSHAEREWLELAPAGPFDRHLRYMWSPETIVTSNTGERISPEMVRGGDRVGILVTRTGGESRFVVKRLVLINEP